MKLSRIQIENFRAIARADLQLDEFVALSGPNSSGKTAVLDAVSLALSEVDGLTPAEARRHVDARRRANRGRTPPVRVSLAFEDASEAVQKTLGAAHADFVLRTTLSGRGQVTRQVDGRVLPHETFLTFRQAIDLVEIPASRDINASSLEPLRSLLRAALLRRRGNGSAANLREAILGRTVSEANSYLGAYESVAYPGGSERLKLAASFNVNLLDEILRSIVIEADVGGYRIPLDALGSGHRSEFVLRLLLDRAGKTSEMTLVLIDEPENHLHPQMAERIAGLLTAPRPGLQTLCTTHSPIFMDAVGLENVATVAFRDGKTTVTPPRSSPAAARAKWGLAAIGLRASDAVIARRVVLVEGSSDEVVLRRLQELRGLGDFGNRGIRLLACQGSANVVESARVLNELGVPWRALLDWDAGFAGGPPMLLPGTDPSELQRDVDALGVHIDRSSGGSGRLLKTLQRLLDESGGVAQLRGPAKEAPAGKLLRLAGADPHEEERLLEALAGGHPRLANRVLNIYGIFILKADLESALLRRPGAPPVAARVLGLSAGHPASELPPKLKKFEHAKQLPSVVDALWEADLLVKNELKTAADFLFG